MRTSPLPSHACCRIWALKLNVQILQFQALVRSGSGALNRGGVHAIGEEYLLSHKNISTLKRDFVPKSLILRQQSQ